MSPSDARNSPVWYLQLELEMQSNGNNSDFHTGLQNNQHLVNT